MRILLRITGVILLAAFWLPAALSGFSADSQTSQSVAVSDGSLADCAISDSPPHGPEAVHQFRDAGGQWWHSKDGTADVFKPYRKAARPTVNCASSMHRRESAELCQNWQFVRRAALLPRAPCFA